MRQIFNSSIISMCDFFFFFSSRRRHTRYWRDWSSDVCSSDLDQKETRQHGEAGCLACHADVSGDRRWRAFVYVRCPKVEGNGTYLEAEANDNRSEERRVGKECRSRWSPYH